LPEGGDLGEDPVQQSAQALGLTLLELGRRAWFGVQVEIGAVDLREQQRVPDHLALDLLADCHRATSRCDREGR
jgi:hypothetical protein